MAATCGGSTESLPGYQRIVGWLMKSLKAAPFMYIKVRHRLLFGNHFAACQADGKKRKWLALVGCCWFLGSSDYFDPKKKNLEFI